VERAGRRDLWTVGHLEIAACGNVKAMRGSNPGETSSSDQGSRRRRSLRASTSSSDALIAAIKTDHHTLDWSFEAEPTFASSLAQRVMATGAPA